jgi:lysophospholipase L1-like esterase
MTTSAGRRRHPAYAAILMVFAMMAGYPASPAASAPTAPVAPPVPRTDLVALGDSYTAGTGADADPLPEPGSWAWTFPCIQTPGGYVDVLAGNAIVRKTGNAACHGALVDAPTPPGQGSVPSVMMQIAGMTSSGELSVETELVTLTAGANDVGVNTALFACTTGSNLACMDAVRTSTHELFMLKPLLTEAYRAIHQAAPRARIAVLGYAPLFDPARSFLGMSAENMQLVNYGTFALNTAIAQAVTAANSQFQANAKFVNVTARFTGHEANSTEPWIYFGQVPVTGPDGNPTPDPRNFHPNAAGHQEYAAAVEAAIPLRGLARR